MKKDISTRLVIVLLYFILIVLIRQWFNSGGVLFLLGAAVGFLFPYLDYFVYLYFSDPNSAFSHEAKALLKPTSFLDVIADMYHNPSVRSKLIFHTGYFYIVMLLLTILIVTSSGSVFGRGLVLSFTLNLLITQVLEYLKTSNISSWIPLKSGIFDKERQLWYLMGNFFLLLILGIVK